VSEKVAFAIRYHQALRFYEDKAHGYPDLYRRMFGADYRPEPYIVGCGAGVPGGGAIEETSLRAAAGAASCS
jgi:hypothetical protein